MALSKQLENKANGVFTGFWNALSALQNVYFTKHGKYFQCLLTPQTSVVDGADVDFENRVPTDEPHPNDRMFTFLTKLPFQVEVDEWTKNDARGFSAIMWITTGDEVYRREVTSDGQDTDWQQFIRQPW